MNFIVTNVILFLLVSNAIGTLDIVNDTELMNMIRTENHVVVLFTGKNCEECDKYENELTSLREDIVETVNAWVVKAVNSPLIRLYSPNKEPAIVFFRHGVPLLYDGPLNDELILHTLTNNKEPAVKELTDETFEHLTQAASGATTGDWFVMFYTTECVECQRLLARWEAVGAQLKSRMNVARVNKGSAGAAVGRRFEIQQVPSFVYFRQGKLYRYPIQKYDVTSFVDFAQNFYKNVKGEKVPVPKSPFDDLVSAIAEYLRENNWVMYLGAGTFVIGLLVSFFLRKGETVKVKKSDHKPEKKKK